MPPNIQSYRRVLVLWTGLVHRFAWFVVIAAVVASAGATAYLTGNIRINTDTEDMLSPDLPFRQHAKELNKAFPQFSDSLLVVIDGQTPDITDDAARALTARLRQQPALFGNVFHPAGDTFFRRNGFLYLGLDDLYDLSDRLAEAQPFLGTLWRDPSLVGLFHMLGLAVEEHLKEDEDTSFEVVTVLNAISDVADAQAAGRFRQLSWQDLMSGATTKDDEANTNRRILVVQPTLDFSSLQPAADVMAELRRLAREMGLTPENGVRLRLTGPAALAHEELESVEKGMGLAGILSLILVISLLIIGLRSSQLVAAMLVTLVMGLIWTATFAILVFGTLNLISVAFAVLFIGLSVDFGIHYGLRYKEGMNRGIGHAEALFEAASQVGGALILCAVSAAIAFYSFLPTDYLGLAELGLIAGTGMFIAFFANMTVLPALLTVMPHLNGASKGTDRKSAGRLSLLPLGVQSFINSNSRAVCWSALAVGLVAAIFFLPKATFDFDPLNLRDPKTESVATIFDLMEDSRATPYSVAILTENLNVAKSLAEKMKALPEVDSTVTVADYIPKDQDEKLDVIATMGLFLMPAFNSAGTSDPPSIEDRRAALGQLQEKLQKLAVLEGGGGEAKAAKRLSLALIGLFSEGAIDAAKLQAFETRLLSALPERLESLKLAMEAEPVTLQSLPPDITKAHISREGKARLDVFPTENLRDREALIRFVEAVRRVAANISGSSVTILEAGDAVINAFWQAGFTSVSLILVLLVIVLKRWSDALLVFAPLVLAALLTVAASVGFNLPFNFANMIVLPLLFGLGVSSGIHLVLREREENSVDGVMETSTPRAVVLSALTTIGSFGSIALSSHPGTSSMGMLLMISISFTLGCTLIVLPALLVVAGKGPENTLNQN